MVKIFALNADCLKVSSTFNPFKKKLFIPISEIVSVRMKIRRYSTRVVVITKSKELDILTSFIPADRKALASLLTKNNVEVIMSI